MPAAKASGGWGLNKKETTRYKALGNLKISNKIQLRKYLRGGGLDDVLYILAEQQWQPQRQHRCLLYQEVRMSLEILRLWAFWILETWARSVFKPSGLFYFYFQKFITLSEIGSATIYLSNHSNR